MKLNDGWRIMDFDAGKGLAADAPGMDMDDADWLPAVVPGGVHTSLWQAGRIPDPYYDRNVETLQWVEEREWWYRMTFQGPDGPRDDQARDELVFDGLDTFATVYLNGQELGSHANMFCPAAFDVTNLLCYGEPNTLAVRFDAVKQRVADAESVDGQWGGYGSEHRVHVRKTQSQFSWDWAPRLVNVGIWRDVRLERYRVARLVAPFVRTLSVDANQANVSVRCQVERWADVGALTVKVRLHRGLQEVRAEAAVVGGLAEPVLALPRPKLWWPAGYGDQALYDVEIELWHGDELLDEFADTVGLRTVELDRTSDPVEVGTEYFRLVVNGVPIFCKGADWIPADLLNGRVDAARYEEWLRLLVEANGNMLRVWGGGQYEKDDFYRLADELGVLIWHDFMFSCALYPDDDPDFVAEVRAEAEYQVQRLRNRASLALWCGNNENDWIEDKVRWDAPGHDFGGKSLYHQHLPEICARLDPSRPYWPSSPYGGNDHNGEQSGDRHNWHVWHGAIEPRRFGEKPQRDWSPEGVSYRRYGDDMGRFISEFGMHAAPIMETLRRNVPESELAFGSEGLLFRNKDNPKDKGNMLMRAHTGLPKDLLEYIDYSMICQAEGLKFGIEHYRRRKFHCAGTLFWQWNDCWPGLSWAVLDYYAFPKAGYFFTKRAYASVLATVRDEADGVSLWVTNDTLQPVEDTLTWTMGMFDGQTVSSGQVAVAVDANSSAQVAVLDNAMLGQGDRSAQYLWLESATGAVRGNRHFFVEIKDLTRQRPTVTVDWERQGDELLAHVSSDGGYAYFVWLIAPVEGTRYSDNWFDLRSGETRTIRIWHPAGETIAPDMIEMGWR